MTNSIKVFITNNSRNDIYFIGSLDASEEKWRSPYCYFKIEKPKNDSTPTLGRCGNMNSLRKKDFRLVRSGKSFNPYETVDGYGFFDSYEIERKENFRIPGIYRITFYYSTKSTKIDDYLGDGNKNKELEELFNMVPHIELESNTLEIEIKEKAGELGHIDTHYLPKGVIANDNTRYYLFGLIDSCTRVVWVELVEDLKALTAMFAALKSFNILADHYNIKFKEVLTDNGSEFEKKGSKTKENHPFERLLNELEIKHRYIRPYRPQTNGKIERFWRTIEDDLIRETYFESKEHLKEEILQYLYYYNEERSHQSLNGSAPNKFNKNCPRIT